MKLLPSNYRSTFYRIYSENKEKYEDKKNDGDWTKIKWTLKGFIDEFYFFTEHHWNATLMNQQYE